MQTRIAIISDIHYSSTPNTSSTRQTSISDILLLRAVHRLNRYIKPDMVILLGDILDNGAGPNAEDERKHIQEIISKLECPVTIIPGNHDGDIDRFYQSFPCPSDMFDVNNVRFVVFNDPEEPDYNACRTEEDLARMRSARSGHGGPLISLQHVPLFKPGTSLSPYSYLNADRIWNIFEEQAYTLAISGHWHPGEDHSRSSEGRTLVVPCLCEDDFAFTELTIDGDDIQTRRQTLKMPAELKLVDYHVHTQYAYCSDNMDMSTNVRLAESMELGAMVFTEHSGQLYYNAEDFWSASVMPRGIETPGQCNRMDNYMEEIQEFSPPVYTGSEIDCDYSGNPVIKPDDMSKLQIKVGAIHWLQELRKPAPDMDRVIDEMLGRLAIFLPCGIQILAHPFRTLRSLGEDIPDRLLSGIVSVLKQNSTAAEINFHTQLTYPSLVNACVESGVKLVFGSDSHSLYEIGEFYPHLQLMSECGYAGSDLSDVLANSTDVVSARPL